ncbi:hypothetical protein F5X68DRAFT_2886 [Plectosphaerella plurivora]|uniref:Uncharacterized protein n=1 Tax=Plectosphaerella plurivora TaxID=936078 RepID=A0A9P9AIA6_9PEZI|nr:hypothetical protein F5X68DRAFT_2886 [Plectosphaerella plurivora]
MPPLVFFLAAFATAVPLEAPSAEDGTLEVSPLWRRANISCPITERSPWISPSLVAVGRMSESFIVNTHGNGTIAGTPDLETLFEFTLDPWDLLHHADGAPRMCGIYFRLTSCTRLPAGYPCHAWTGMEQQVLSGGGMYFHHVYDSHDGRVPPPGGSKKSWEAVDVVQIWPDEVTLAGTFPCLVDRDRAMKRNVSFVGTATEGWGVGFPQAGVGKQEDVDPSAGTGAFVVGCGSDTEDGPRPDW